MNTSGNVTKTLIKKNMLGMDSKVLLNTKLYNGINKLFIVPSINDLTEFIAPVTHKNRDKTIRITEIRKIIYLIYKSS